MRDDPYISSLVPPSPSYSGRGLPQELRSLSGGIAFETIVEGVEVGEGVGDSIPEGLYGRRVDGSERVQTGRQGWGG